MRTISLEEALKLGTKGPLHFSPTDDPLKFILWDKSATSIGRIYFSDDATLLTHAYNMLPELVKALNSLLKFYPALWEGDEDVLGVRHNDATDALSEAEAILKEATTIQLPS